MRKGIRQQIEEGGKSTPMESSLTEKDFMSFLQDLNESPSRSRPPVFIVKCLEQGVITQSTEDIKLCENPNCKNCRNFESALKEQCK
jgi:hypothetical protein